ncbi:hypothetical protein Droror1_Dr00014512 [Drosera rotundifolia]
MNGGVEEASMNKRRKLDHSAHHETRSPDGFIEQSSRNKRRKLNHSPHNGTGSKDPLEVVVDIIELEEHHRDHADLVDPPLWFSTGQALGGHMRKHYLKFEPVLLLAGQDESESQSQQGEGGDRGTDIVILPFDLNELPFVVDLEDDHGHDMIRCMIE